MMWWILGFALADDGCVREGVQYNAKGEVVGCEGGGSWCSGMPTVPGMCDLGASATVPEALKHTWVPHGGVCRGSTFTIQADRVAYQGALEPLGTGRILAVTEEKGATLIRTILEGRGGYLRLWPTKEEAVFDFGFGVTREASMERKCSVTQAKNPGLFLGK